MNKLFGTSKPKPAPAAPANNINAPTLGETSQKVSNKSLQYLLQSNLSVSLLYE